MSFRISLILFAFFMATGIGSYSAVRNGFYPIAIVDIDLISAKSLQENSVTAYHYFKNSLLVSGSDPRQLDTPESKKEIKRAALDKLISDALILKELKLQAKNEYEAVAERNVDKFITGNQNVEQGAKLLYGLELADFKNEVLMPEAYREILQGRMFLKNQNFDSWLTQERSQAKILILSPDLQWQDGGVKLRN